MKKQVTLLSILALTGGIAFGQSAINQSLPKSKLTPQKFATEFSSSQVKTTVNGGLEKASGDTAWVNHFETPSEWTQGGTSTDFTVNGWSIGTTTNGWYFPAAGNMGTSGKFARFVNGDPTANPETDIPGPFTLEFNNTINLTGKVAPFLEFEQYGARFITKQQVQVSIDGGTTWLTASTNQDIAPLTQGGGSVYPKPQTRRFFIGNLIAADPSAVKIRLFWDGDMNGGSMSYVEYGWYVDNIRIMEGYPDNITTTYASNVTGAQALHYSMFPASQVAATAKTAFNAIAKNVGTNSQDLVVTVTEPSVSFSATSTPAVTVAAGNVDTMKVLLANGYTIPATVGTYTFNYSVTSTNHTLSLTSDDVATKPFEVTTDVMAVDSYDGTTGSITGTFTGWQGGTGDAGIGTYYEMFQAGSFQHVQVGIGNISAGSQAQYLNILNVSVYKYDGTQFNPYAVSQDVQISNADFGNLVDVPFTTPVAAVAGDVFMVVAGFYDGAPVPIAFAGYIPDGQTIGVNGSTITGLLSDDSLKVEAPIVRINFGVYNTVSIAPTPDQTIMATINGTTLTVTEGPAPATSREWKFSTTSGSGYGSFSPAQTSSSYTPNFATVGTYYVVCESTFPGPDVVTSNEVKIIVTPNTTGIEENAAPSFAVYSVENGLNVDLSSTELKGATIQVVSMDGKVVAKQALTTNQMNTIKVNVPTGIYFYAISNNSNSYQGKVFIK